MTIDPRAEKYYSMSTYNYVANNPILNIDPNGDTLRAVNETSGQRTLDLINNTGNINNSGLFSLSGDGKTFNSIPLKAFYKSLKGLSKDEKALAIGYMRLINSEKTNVVEAVNRDETLSEYGQSMTGLSTGAEIDSELGGGVTTLAAYEPGMVNSIPANTEGGHYAVLVMDSKASVQYSNNISRSSLPGELLAHEIIGHGLGANAYDGSGHAVQATNIYLRIKGSNYHRPDHGISVMTPGINTRAIPHYLRTLDLKRRKR